MNTSFCLTSSAVINERVDAKLAQLVIPLRPTYLRNAASVLITKDIISAYPIDA